MTDDFDLATRIARGSVPDASGHSQAADEALDEQRYLAFIDVLKIAAKQYGWSGTGARVGLLHDSVVVEALHHDVVAAADTWGWPAVYRALARAMEEQP